MSNATAINGREFEAPSIDALKAVVIGYYADRGVSMEVRPIRNGHTGATYFLLFGAGEYARCPVRHHNWMNGEAQESNEVLTVRASDFRPIAGRVSLVGDRMPVGGYTPVDGDGPWSYRFEGR